MKIDQIIPVASCLIHNSDNKILILKRSSAHRTYHGYWQLPEGKIEGNESPIEALMRELKEEIGLEVTDLKIKPLVTTTVTIGETHGLVIRIVYEGFTNKIIKLSNEHTEYKWIEPGKAPKLKFVPGTRACLKLVEID